MIVAPPTRSVERWTYIGRRLLADGGVAVAFLDPAGKTRLYPRRGRLRTVGGIYAVTVERAAGEVVASVLHGAQYVGRVNRSDERFPGWVADDRAAHVADAARQREERASDHAGAFGQLTLDEVRIRVLSLPAPQRTALLANVLTHIGF